MKNLLDSKSSFVFDKVQIITLGLVLVLLCFFYNKSRVNINFINKDYNLDKFRNTVIFSRGLDRDKNNIIFIYNTEHSLNGPYVVKINLNSNYIVETSKKLVKDTTIIDTAMLNNIALEFNKLNIEYLAVDSNYNYYLNILSTEDFNLVKFKNIKLKTKDFDVGWSKIEGNWYEKD